MNALAIQRMGPDDAAVVRALRLAALAEAPDAFGTTYAEDAVLALDAWREPLRDPTRAMVVALWDGEPAGMAAGAAYPWTEAENSAGLFGMWVDPRFRQRGVGGALVDAVVAWARAAGHTRILLDVGDANASAIALYASRGFEPTGVTSTLPAPRTHVSEHQRALDLSA